MLSNKKFRERIITTRDLIEGDIAVVLYKGLKHLVYAFYRRSDEPLSIVSLNYRKYYWDDAHGANLIVKEILHNGDTIEVTDGEYDFI